MDTEGCLTREVAQAHSAGIHGYRGAIRYPWIPKGALEPNTTQVSRGGRVSHIVRALRYPWIRKGA